MQEWVALFLLPIAAASGWYAAKQHYTKKYLINHTHSLRQAYVRGLNYLLNEKTDKAIDAFATLLVSDVETIETHIALGNLFRRRGEIEKAIEIHEKLIVQGNLSEAQRANAHFELGMDYLRSGLFDRAESILTNLVDHPIYGKSALQQLLQIYQQERDWRKAMECTRRLRLMNKVPRGETAAQFLCELAEEAFAEDRDLDVLRYLEEALREDPKCVRASLSSARMQMRSGRFDLAVQALQNIELQDPAYIPEILAPLRICYQRWNRSAGELIAYLSHLYEAFGCDDVAVCLAERLRAEKGIPEAADYLRRVSEAKPSLKVLSALIDVLLCMDGGGDTQRKDALSGLSSSFGRMLSEKPRYRCAQCGFSGAELHWRCPSCRHWESTKPI
ncbi:MAG TPA: lipopolysaccharide assembly protein LapB [Methylococcaceae bacterium]|jgi:lipopolysaccharide biosynthesis regulator YciM|nr:lipopolysaccharide assembly protein LapB [Methylococcaceae bacterium]